MTVKKIFSLTAFAALALSACGETVTPHGHVLHESQLKQLTVGVHDKNDVIHILGSPSSQGTFKDDRWYYISTRGVGKPFEKRDVTERTVLVVMFDEAGKLASLNRKTLADGAEVEPLDDETPTQGQALGVVDQILDNFGRTGF